MFSIISTLTSFLHTSNSDIADPSDRSLIARVNEARSDEELARILGR